nr:efflux RND transporter periplasmic adaptor subunit [Luteimonas wenzhouensis]
MMSVDFPVPSLRALLVPACAVFLFAGCGESAPSNGARGQAPAAVVTTAVVAPSPWQDTISALGTVKARESVEVTAKVSETVERVHFESGDEVEAGATLVTLSGRQQQAALEVAEAAAREAEQQYRRGRELVQQQLISRSQLDTQRATRDAALARVAQMRADIGDRHIRAPFAGRLGIRQVSPGALVTPGTVVATLDDLSRVYVDFPVPEVHLARLAEGLPLAATSVAWPGVEFAGEVSSIDARVDPATRAITVRGDFPNPERRLRPGMLLQVELGHASRQALVVPEIAVVQVGRETFAWRVTGEGTVERAMVRVGERRAGAVEILEGLAAGDRIVVEGTGKLRPGMAISDAAASPATGEGNGSGDGAGG